MNNEEGLREKLERLECKDYEARRKQMENQQVDGFGYSKEDREAMKNSFTISNSDLPADYFFMPNGGCGIKLPEYHGEITCDNLKFNGKFVVDEDNLMTLIKKVVQWHHDRNLIDGSTDKDQTLKLAQELGELSDSVCKGKDIRDDIGDMLVVMLNIAERNHVTLGECLERAWQDIKDRKGKMIDGIFVKESDL